MTYTPGFGDEATWPACIGHPLDPRTPDDDSDDTTAELIAEVRCFIVAAELAAMHGDMDKGREALIDARLSIENLIGDNA